MAHLGTREALFNYCLWGSTGGEPHLLHCNPCAGGAERRRGGNGRKKEKEGREEGKEKEEIAGLKKRGKDEAMEGGNKRKRE